MYAFINLETKGWRSFFVKKCVPLIIDPIAITISNSIKGEMEDQIESFK
jgi:hypothetical protein